VTGLRGFSRFAANPLMFRRVAGWSVLALWLATSGCLEPKPSTRQPRVLAGGGRLVDVRLPQSNDGLVSYGVHDPRSGRASKHLASRHGFRPYMPASPEETATVFAADFDKAARADDLDWLRVGIPWLALVKDEEQGAYLRIHGADHPGLSGIVKHLYAAPFVGRTLVCQVRTRWSGRARGSTASRPLAVGSADAGVPIVRFVILVEGGRERAVNWPLVWRPTPDWEYQRAVWTVPPDLLAIRLEVLVPGGDLAVEFDDFLIYDPRALDLAGPCPQPELIPEPPAPGRNLLPGGAFEAGQKCFGVLAYEPAYPLQGTGGVALRAAPVPWYLDKPGAVGNACLAVPLHAHDGSLTGPGSSSVPPERTRVWFGPARIDPPAEYVVSFLGKATQLMPVEVSMWIEGKDAGRAALKVSQSWQRLQHSFRVRGPHGPGAAYVVIEAAPEPAAAPVGLWLDGVILSPTMAPDAYEPPDQVEVGILGPAHDSLDVGHLIDQGDSVAFKVRLVNYSQRAFVGELCMDVVDALDRVVWTTDLNCKLGPRGYASDTRESSHQLHLDRGYYRILATAWNGARGNGQLLSLAARPFAVVNLCDPLPPAAPLGMPVAPGRFSNRLTQWGFGWARVALEGPEAEADPGKIADLVKKCLAQRLEIVGECSSVGQTMPPPISPHSIVPVSRLAQWRATPLRGRIATVSDSLIVRLADGSDPLDQVALLAGGDASTPPSAFEWKPPLSLLPEDVEGELERLCLLASPGRQPRWWERGIHLAPTTNLPLGLRVESVDSTGGDMRRAPLDPALEASETVRAIALRLWYGFDRVALAAYPFQAADPAGGGACPLAGPTTSAFNEYDHSPRPVLAALDFAAEMLNDKAPVDWIDGWKQARALCFEGTGGKGVALVWRPLGTTASLHRLPGLAPLPASRDEKRQDVIEVRNCFGGPEPCRTVGEDLYVPVSSFVLYLSAEGSTWSRLRDALSTALVGPAELLHPG
jgi:hypothetical protein